MSRIFILNVFIFIFAVILAVESIDDQQKRTNWNKAVGLWGKRSKFDDADPSNWSGKQALKMNYYFDKRNSWQKANGLWGKRANWDTANGLWGKRSDLSHGVLSSSNRIDRAESDITADWNAANGLWGKRSVWEQANGLWG